LFSSSSISYYYFFYYHYYYPYYYHYYCQAEKLFDKAVKEWEVLERPRDEIASLIKVSPN